MLAPRRSGVPVLVPLLVFAALIGSSALSQELTTGTLEGTVIAQDTGDPIEGVVVTAVGPQGVRSAVTDEMGRYVIPGLVSGSYVVRCECPGYATFIQSEVAVKIGTRTQLPFSLPAGLVEEVTVTSEAPVVDMKSTGTGQAIRIDDVAPYIPIGRNIVSTFALAPGVTDGGDVGEVNRSISGSSGLENVYFIDGVNITNSGYGALGAYSLVYGSLGTGVTYEFLEEIQVKTGGFEPEYGQAGGGVVNAVVKSGTNRFTADLAWYETADPSLRLADGVRGRVLLRSSDARSSPWEDRSSGIACSTSPPTTRSGRTRVSS